MNAIMRFFTCEITYISVDVDFFINVDGKIKWLYFFKEKVGLKLNKLEYIFE